VGHGWRHRALQCFIAFVLLTFALVVTRAAVAEDVAVPVGLQAELIGKVASYDKSFAARSGDRAQILILVKSGSADSSRTAAHMQSALAALPQVGGLPHDEHMVSYSGGGALSAYVKARRISIVYVTPGFAEDVGDIRASLDGVDVLSVAAVPEYVPKGIVLGFDLVSGKSKLLVNLTQAKKQNVAFKAEVLKMMKVHE
jgi:hypothetical protein